MDIVWNVQQRKVAKIYGTRYMWNIITRYINITNSSLTVNKPTICYLAYFASKKKEANEKIRRRGESARTSPPFFFPLCNDDAGSRCLDRLIRSSSIFRRVLRDSVSLHSIPFSRPNIIPNIDASLEMHYIDFCQNSACASVLFIRAKCSG